MDAQPDKPSTPAEWVAALRASKAEIERGEKLPMQPTIDRMLSAIERIDPRETDVDHHRA